jgi:hypothetical protein
MQMIKNFMAPGNTDVCLEDEFRHIVQWSVQNKLTLNVLKLKEMVFHCPVPCRFVAPPPPVGTERVTTFKAVRWGILDRLFDFDELISC